MHKPCLYSKLGLLLMTSFDSQKVYSCVPIPTFSCVLEPGLALGACIRTRVTTDGVLPLLHLKNIRLCNCLGSMIYPLSLVLSGYPNEHSNGFSSYLRGLRNIVVNVDDFEF